MTHDLNKRIAEALGYDIRAIGGNQTIMRYPVSAPIIPGALVFDRVGDGSEYAWLYLPNWAGNLNAAWALPLPDTATRYLEWGHASKLPTARILWVREGKNWPGSVSYQDEKAATALCEAWLMWKGQGDE